MESLDKKNNRKTRDSKEHMMDLMEEVGELARSINRKEIRNEEPDHSVESEVIDVLVILLWIANHYGMEIESEFKKSMEKWKERFELK